MIASHPLYEEYNYLQTLIMCATNYQLAGIESEQLAEWLERQAEILEELNFQQLVAEW